MFKKIGEFLDDKVDAVREFAEDNSDLLIGVGVVVYSFWYGLAIGQAKTEKEVYKDLVTKREVLIGAKLD